MVSTSPQTKPNYTLFAIGVLAFIILTLRFSPNWVEFHRDYATTVAQATTPSERSTLERSFLSYSGRAYYVMRQAIDLDDPIEDLNHKIVRWRLFFPAVGNLLHLPAWLLLGLSQVGAFSLILVLTHLGWSFSANHQRRLLAGFCFALIAGATAPFLTSMGLLGYYDSWLALGLLAISFARSRALVLLACLATPWVDERLVIGLPLSLGIRFVTRPTCEGVSFWHCGLTSKKWTLI